MSGNFSQFSMNSTTLVGHWRIEIAQYLYSQAFFQSLLIVTVTAAKLLYKHLQTIYKHRIRQLPEPGLPGGRYL